MTLIRNQYDKTKQWNFISRSLAYITFIALLAGVILFASGILNQPANPAFADVLEQIRSVQTLRFTSTVDMPNMPEGMDAQIFHTDYMEPGKQRVEMPGGNIMIMDMVKQKTLSLIPSQKKASLLAISKQTGSQTESNFIEGLRRLQDGAEIVLGHKEINGKLACGFQVNQGGMDYTIWADLKTNLPVRVELKMAMSGDMKITLSDFEFNPSLDESLFSLVPPADYEIVAAPEVNTSIPTESDFIETLRMVTDYNNGEFPESLILQELAQLVGKATLQGDNATEEKATEYGTQFGKLMHGLLFFQLNAKNDWHYEGKGVQRGGKQAVCWWRPAGSPTYRVIYADLTAADVRPEDFTQTQ